MPFQRIRPSPDCRLDRLSGTRGGRETACRSGTPWIDHPPACRPTCMGRPPCIRHGLASRLPTNEAKPSVNRPSATSVPRGVCPTLDSSLSKSVGASRGTETLSDGRKHGAVTAMPPNAGLPASRDPRTDRTESEYRLQVGSRLRISRLGGFRRHGLASGGWRASCAWRVALQSTIAGPQPQLTIQTGLHPI